MWEVGGFYKISQEFMLASPNSTIWESSSPIGNRSSPTAQCGKPPANSLHLIRSADDTQLPWPGVFFGLTVTSIWYWCTDQARDNFS